MTQMVFVHGVSVRRDAANPAPYNQEVADRDGRFRNQAFRGAAPNIRNPYWGVFGANPAWKDASIPKLSTKGTALATGLGGGGLGGAAAAPPDLIVNSARLDFPALVAGLSVAAMDQLPKAAARRAAEEEFWAAAGEYAEANPAPAWLKGPGAPQTDAAFFAKFKAEVQGQVAVRAATGHAPLKPAAQQALGLFDGLKSAADALIGGTSNLINAPALKIAREAISPKVAIFLGDVFRYLKDGPGSGRADIRKVVLADIEAAAKDAKANGEKLVIAGHSMGAVILYDLLSDPAEVAKLSAAIGQPFKVDLLLTIGTQIGLFEELKSFASSQPGIKAPAKVPALGCVANWWNVYDKMDVLSFLSEPVFDGVKDLAADTTAGIIDAHVAYFKSAVFYARLNARLKGLGLAP